MCICAAVMFWKLFLPAFSHRFVTLKRLWFSSITTGKELVFSVRLVSRFGGVRDARPPSSDVELRCEVSLSAVCVTDVFFCIVFVSTNLTPRLCKNKHVAMLSFDCGCTPQDDRKSQAVETMESNVQTSFSKFQGKSLVSNWTSELKI